MVRRSGLALLAVCMIALFVSCGTGNAPADGSGQEGSQDHPAVLTPDETQERDAPLDIPTAGHIAEYPVAATLDEMWERSGHVVSGRFDRLEEVWNMARDPADPSKESETDRFLGRLYTFTVEETLKGEAAGEILVNIPYMQTIRGEFSNAVWDQSGKLEKEATEFYPYRVERLWDYYIEPGMGQRYMLFLSYGASNGHYFPAIEPYRVSLAEDGSMSVESTLLLPEEELAARRETIYQMENGRDFRYTSNAFDTSFDCASADMTLQDFLKQVNAPSG